MKRWYTIVRDNMSEIVSCLDYYEQELKEARFEVKISGIVEKNSTDLPSFVELRFSQLQDIESILEHLNIKLRKTRSKYFRQYLEGYAKVLSSRDAEKYADGEDEVVDLMELINYVSLIRNQFQGITKGFEIKRGAKKSLRFNAFFWVNNVLNTWNVLGVFPYTGQPNDDGFLNSPQGKLLVKTQTDAQSYIDLYKILLNSQTGNWNAPRTIRLGLRLNLN